MKKVKAILELIENTSIYTVDDSPFLQDVFMNHGPFETTDEEALCFFNWRDDEHDYEICFSKAGLEGATFKDNQIFLKNMQGEDSVITLYDIFAKRIDSYLLDI